MEKNSPNLCENAPFVFRFVKIKETFLRGIAFGNGML